MTGNLIDDEKEGFREGSLGCVDQICTLKQISGKAGEKILSLCGFYRLGEGV